MTSPVRSSERDSALIAPISSCMGIKKLLSCRNGEKQTAMCGKCTKFIKIIIYNYSIASGTRQEAEKWVIPSAGRQKANCLAKCCFCEKMTTKSDKLCRKMMVMKNIFWTREKKGDIIYPIMEQCFRCSGSIKMR